MGREGGREEGRATDLRVLRLGDVNENLGRRVDNVKKFHDGGTVVGNSDIALVVVDELIHPSGSERRPHHIRHRSAGVNVADQLRFALGRVRSFLQKYDLGLLQKFSPPFPQHMHTTVSISE